MKTDTIECVECVGHNGINPAHRWEIRLPDGLGKATGFGSTRSFAISNAIMIQQDVIARASRVQRYLKRLRKQARTQGET